MRGLLILLVLASPPPSRAAASRLETAVKILKARGPEWSPAGAEALGRLSKLDLDDPSNHPKIERLAAHMAGAEAPAAGSAAEEDLLVRAAREATREASRRAAEIYWAAVAGELGSSELADASLLTERDAAYLDSQAEFGLRQAAPALEQVRRRPPSALSQDPLSAARRHAEKGEWEAFWDASDRLFSGLGPTPDAAQIEKAYGDIELVRRASGAPHSAFQGSFGDGQSVPGFSVAGARVSASRYLRHAVARTKLLEDLRRRSEPHPLVENLTWAAASATAYSLRLVGLSMAALGPLFRLF